MAMKDVSDIRVLEAVRELNIRGYPKPAAHELLSKWTGQPEKVCLRCVERAVSRGYLDYGVSLNWPWLTPEGEYFLNGNEFNA